MSTLLNTAFKEIARTKVASVWTAEREGEGGLKIRKQGRSERTAGPGVAHAQEQQAEGTEVTRSGATGSCCDPNPNGQGITLAPSSSA